MCDKIIMSSSLRSSFVFLRTSYAKERYFTRGPRLCQQISFKTLFEHSSLSSTAERKTDDLIFLVHKRWLSVLNPGAAILDVVRQCQAPLLCCWRTNIAPGTCATVHKWTLKFWHFDILLRNLVSLFLDQHECDFVDYRNLFPPAAITCFARP